MRDDQPTFNFDGPVMRRIDITLCRVDENIAALGEDQIAELTSKPWWHNIIVVSRLRSMEISEIEARGHAMEQMADAYDRVVQPGQNAIQALLATFRAVYCTPRHPLPHDEAPR